MHIRVQVSLKNGDWIEKDGASDLLDRLRALEAHGLSGRRLIAALFTERWAAPPEFVRLLGTDHAERPVDVTIFGD